MNSSLRRALRTGHFWFSMILFDPIEVLRKYRALPYFIRHWRAFSKGSAGTRFKPRIRDIWYRAHDRFDTAGSAEGHYFFQDLWVATRLQQWGVKRHVDVGSRLDGFIAHLLPFCAVTYVDIRPLRLDWPGFEFKQGSITQMPFEDGSVESLSSLHVIEHIGLGRYSDPVDASGYLKAAAELSRVLKVGGRLVVGVPVGRERTCFDAHRVFDPATIERAFADLRLVQFLLIDDRGQGIGVADFEVARQCDYGCGIFVFEK